MNKIFNRVADNVKKEKFLSLSNVLVMTVTFLILGVFITIISLTQTGIRQLEQQAQITVFFKDDYSQEKIMALKDQYSKDTRIHKISYVSKDEAFKIFSEINKDEPALLESISANILPASLEIQTKNIADLAKFSDEFTKLEGVEDVRYFKSVIDQFKFWSNIFYIGGFVLLFIFLSISYAVILTTLKATINSKGTELAIMKLVGASDNYIKKPFLYQGLLFGLISSAIAGSLLLLLSIFSVALKWLPNGIALGYLYGLAVNPIIFSLIVFVLLLIFGGTLGYLGSYAALKKYLKY